MTKTSKTVLSIILAILSIVLMTVLIEFMDEPSKNKYRFYSVLISILSGISASLFSGIFKISTKTVMATSGFAVFFIVLVILLSIENVDNFATFLQKLL